MVISEARPASTVALLRDGDKGLETLLLRRNNALRFAGGMWVFPGGSIEPEDVALSNGDISEASRIAASRESYEESGLRPDLNSMILLSHWITPDTESKRFATSIYCAPVENHQEVIIDNSEIHHYCWIPIKNAIIRHQMNKLNIVPPTYLTLKLLEKYDSLSDAIDGESNRVPYEACGVFSKTAEKGIMIAMFSGDAGYQSADSTVPGAKHRVVFNGKYWTYIRQNLTNDVSDFSQ